MDPLCIDATFIIPSLAPADRSLVMISKPLAQTLNWRPALARVALACALSAAGLAHASSEAVGQVSLLIGDAWVVHSDGSRQALKRGASIQVGDRIETSANGHVHVRFVDNGAVSVRPDSVLQVQAYRYAAQQPLLNEVRLKVEQGTSRSISGAATEADKNRFRLNTPIAAIGVRGTDFIVQTDKTGMRATVSDGAIVVGALGAGCLANALGPCGGKDARLLSSDMGRFMVEVKPGEQMARVVPAAGAALASAAFSAEERVAARAAAESAARVAGILAARPRESDTAASLGVDTKALAALSAASVDLTPLNRFENSFESQMVWGRYSIAPNPDDKLSVPYAIAALNRHITVGDESVGLFRANDPSNPSGQLPASLNAKVDFRLTRAAVTFEGAGISEAATVHKAVLSLDFANRSFATVLDLSSSHGGKADFRMAGQVASDGTFAVQEGNQRIAGAVSLDAKEAGYQFQRGTTGGLFKGRTLWGR